MILVSIPTVIFTFFLDITYVRCSSGDYEEELFNGVTSDESEEEIQDSDFFQRVSLFVSTVKTTT
jgi:hypothetical protein